METGNEMNILIDAENESDFNGEFSIWRPAEKQEVSTINIKMGGTPADPVSEVGQNTLDAF